MCARHYYNGVGIFYNAMLANSVHKQDAMLVAIEIRSEGDTETIHKKKKKIRTRSDGQISSGQSTSWKAYGVRQLNF